MSDKPILFSAPMVRALLDGRKTQTRRILKPQVTAYPDGPAFRWGKFEGLWPDDWFGYGNEIDGALPFRPGDRLWVRETWRAHKSWDVDAPRFILPTSRVWYEADERDNCDAHGKTRVSIHMPRWASRLTLIVTDVRVERLRDISTADAKAEGIEQVGSFYRNYLAEEYPLTPTGSFETLWNSINGPGAWDANPWVCAVSFVVHRGNIATLSNEGEG